MHKLLKTLTLTVCALFSLGAAAQNALLEPFPIDPEVRMGKLDNGLTYIIRHNEKPANRAHFLIAQRVGSMQEEDNQSGLAHFLEHMAFNGTKNFPGKHLINYLEENGIKFGKNLNAYTAFDETVYMIMDAPSTRQSMVDSCLLILHDWSTAISLEDEEIDKERGVIQEEWRSRDNGSLRAYTEVLKHAFPNDHRYGKRMPIGSMDVVMNFDPETLRAYYHRWYRPDLQGIIVVGDVDVDAVEAQIKETFAHITLDPSLPEREYFKVPDQTEPISMVVTDPEIVGTSITASYTTDATPIPERNNPLFMMQNYIMDMLCSMMNERFAEQTMKPDAPYLNASLTYGDYLVALTRDALSLTVVADKGKYKGAMDAAVADLMRAAKYGFSESEYARVRTQYLTTFDNLLQEKENRDNAEYADEYAKYFTQGGYIPGIEVEHQWAQAIAQQIPVAAINQALENFVFHTGNNLTLYLMAPTLEDVTYPTGEQLLAEYKAATEQEVQPYEEQAVGEALMKELPQGGSIVSDEAGQELGSTLLTLSNGVKVYLLPLTHEKNQVNLTGVSPGGTSLYDETKEDISLKALNEVATVGGVADYNPIQLDRVLTGKTVGVYPSITTTRELIKGSSNAKDIETMLQLAYLYMTDVRPDTALFRTTQDRILATLKARETNPMNSVSRDSIPNLLYGDEKMIRPLTVDEVKQIDYGRVLEIYRERFANADDFTFFITGDFDPEAMKPLVAQYLGALPSTKRVDTPDLSKVISYAPRSKVTHFDFKMDTPTSTVLDAYAGTGEYTLREQLTMGLLADVLNQTFHVSIREDEGGTYGVSVAGSVDRIPAGERSLAIMYQTRPEDADRLNGIVKTQLNEIAEKGIDESYFKKAVLNREKSFAEAQETNSYWSDLLFNKIIWKEDFHKDYLDTLHSITPEDVRVYLQGILKDDHYYEMIASGKPDAK